MLSAPFIEDGDTIWIHDYQLMLLPQLIREKYPNTKIGFFLHIPFPSYEIFRLLIWRVDSSKRAFRSRLDWISYLRLRAPFFKQCEKNLSGWIIPSIKSIMTTVTYKSMPFRWESTTASFQFQQKNSDLQDEITMLEER